MSTTAAPETPAPRRGRAWLERWTPEDPAFWKETGRRIAWRSEPGSTVENAGVVRFSPVGDGSATRVDIQLSYNPPAGFLGDVVASLFGKDPKSAMDEDLVRFQTLVEEGRTRVEGHRVTAEELRPDA